MGLFSAAKKAFKKVVKPAARIAGRFIPGPVGIAATAIGGGFAGEEISRAIRGGPPAVRLPPLPPGLGRPLGRQVGPPRGGVPSPFGRGVEIGGMIGQAAACPAGFHLAKDGSGRCVRNRRMNPLNPRAARRAIRRIKGAMKMLRQIERQLPKQRSRRAPAGHRARLTHE